MRQKLLSVLFLVTFLVLMSVSGALVGVGATEIGEQEAMENIKDELKFREDAGLETNIDKVIEISEGYEKSKRFGVYLTPKEESELIKRFDFQDKVAPVLMEKMEQKTNGDYSFYVDQANGGIFHVGIKNPDIFMGDIEKLFPDKNMIKITHVEKTRKDLQEIHDDIWGEREKYSGEGIEIVQVSTSIKEQKVIVGIENLTSEGMILEEIYENVEVQEAEEGRDDSRANTFDPLQGGAKINVERDGVSYNVRSQDECRLNGQWH